jgi:hypothetical protein
MAVMAAQSLSEGTLENGVCIGNIQAYQAYHLVKMTRRDEKYDYFSVISKATRAITAVARDAPL